MPRSLSQAQIIRILRSIGMTGVTAAFTSLWNTLGGGTIGAKLLRIEIDSDDMIYDMKINAATMCALGLSFQYFQQYGQLKSFEQYLMDEPIWTLVVFISLPTFLPVVINRMSRSDEFPELLALAFGGLMTQLFAIILFLLMLEAGSQSQIFARGIDSIGQLFFGDEPHEVAYRRVPRQHQEHYHHDSFFEAMLCKFSTIAKRYRTAVNSFTLANASSYFRQKKLVLMKPVLKYMLKDWHAGSDPFGYYYAGSLSSLDNTAVQNMQALIQHCYDLYKVDPSLLDMNKINFAIEEIMFTINFKNMHMQTLDNIFAIQLRAFALTTLAELKNIPASSNLRCISPPLSVVDTKQDEEEKPSRKKKKKRKKKEITSSPKKLLSPRNSFFQSQQQAQTYGALRILTSLGIDEKDEIPPDTEMDEKPNVNVNQEPLPLPLTRLSAPTMSVTPEPLQITLPTAPKMNEKPEFSPTALSTTPKMIEKPGPSLPATPKINEKPESLPVSLSPTAISPSLPTSKPMPFRSLSAPGMQSEVSPAPVAQEAEIIEIARVVLNDFEKKVFALLKSLVTTKNHNYKIYIVGGWAYDKVREVVLGIPPCQYNDIDFVTDIPQELLLAYNAFHKVPQVNGLFTSKLDNIPIDIIHEPDLSSLTRNVKSRDFMTLYIDELGRVFDPTGIGLARIHLRQLNSAHEIGNIFKDDPLVILRAIYLSTKRNLNLTEYIPSIMEDRQWLVPSYYEATPQSKKYLHPHRMNLRIKKIFSQHHALQNYSIMKELGILEVLFPSIVSKMNLYFDWIWNELTNTNKFPWPKLERIYALFIASALGESTFWYSLDHLVDTGNDIAIFPQATAIWQSSILFQDVFESPGKLYQKLRDPLQSYRTYHMNKYAAQFMTLPPVTFPNLNYMMQM